MSVHCSQTPGAHRSLTLAATAAALGVAGLLPFGSAFAVAAPAAPLRTAAAAITAKPRLESTTLPAQIRVSAAEVTIPFTLTFTGNVPGIIVQLINRGTGEELAHGEYGYPASGQRESVPVTGIDAYGQIDLQWVVTIEDVSGNRIPIASYRFAAAGRGQTRDAVSATRTGTLITIHGKVTAYNNTKFVVSADRGVVIQRLVGTTWVAVTSTKTTTKGVVIVKVHERKGTHLRLVAVTVSAAWSAPSRVIVA